MNRRPTLSLPGASNSARLGTAQIAADEHARRFDDALHCMQTGRWHDAFAELAALADAGHAPAARLALLFAARGTRLFGGRYDASPRRQAAWSRVAD